MWRNRTQQPLIDHYIFILLFIGESPKTSCKRQSYLQHLQWWRAADQRYLLLAEA